MSTKRGNETWDGGYVRRNKAGKPSYIIYKKLNQRLYEISTRTSTHRAAMMELARFEMDPENYRPGGPVKPEAICLTPQLSLEFLTWSAKPKDQGGKGNSSRHVHYQSKYLAWWADQLSGVDLRNAPLGKIEEALDGTPSRANKLITIRALYTWLVEVKRILAPNEDPTFRRLKVPKAKAAQLTEEKAITAEEFWRVRKKLAALSEEMGRSGRPKFSPYWLDCIDVLAGTGWHVTELERFSEGGRLEEVERKDGAGVLMVIHKSGDQHKTLVSQNVLEAARRIRERALDAEGAKRKGTFRGDGLRTALQRACDHLGIARLHPGSFRHSIATHAINQGVEIGSASDFLGHRSKETTRKFYATHAIPAKVPTFI